MLCIVFVVYFVILSPSTEAAVEHSGHDLASSSVIMLVSRYHQFLTKYTAITLSCQSQNKPDDEYFCTRTPRAYMLFYL